MTTNKSRIFARISVLTLAFALFAPLIVNAAQITSGSLTLSDSRPDQTGVSYSFSGASFSGTSIGCIRLELDSSADGTGGIPSGILTTSSTFDDTASTLVSGWSVDNTTNGTLQIENATPAAPAASGIIEWDVVENGDTADTTYYGILTTYTTDACSVAVDTTTVAFMYKGGALVSLTVDPTLTFTVAGVASGLAVNGPNTTLTSTATAIDFSNDVTSGVKGVSAHDVTVATNGGGFTVYLKQSGNLSNGTHTITPWTGTNGTPTTFPAAGTEAWGYTTNDSDLLTGGTNTRFTSASNWAGMSTTNQLVADLGTAGTQTSRIGHQLGLATSTPAGNYNTTLVYTAAGSY